MFATDISDKQDPEFGAERNSLIILSNKDVEESRRQSDLTGRSNAICAASALRKDE
jgi:hypothetical protein